MWKKQYPAGLFHSRSALRQTRFVTMNRDSINEQSFRESPISPDPRTAVHVETLVGKHPSANIRTTEVAISEPRFSESALSSHLHFFEDAIFGLLRSPSVTPGMGCR